MNLHGVRSSSAFGTEGPCLYGEDTRQAFRVWTPEADTTQSLTLGPRPQLLALPRDEFRRVPFGPGMRLSCGEAAPPPSHRASQMLAADTIQVRTHGSRSH